MTTKLNADWDEYKASRNKVNIALRQAKADYYRNKIATQNNIIHYSLSHLFKRHASLTQQYAGLQEGRVQRKITRSIKL